MTTRSSCWRCTGSLRGLRAGWRRIQDLGSNASRNANYYYFSKDVKARKHALPENPEVITLLAIAGLTHRQAYFDLAMVAMLAPFLSLVVLIGLGTLFGSF